MNDFHIEYEEACQHKEFETVVVHLSDGTIATDQVKCNKCGERFSLEELK